MEQGMKGRHAAFDVVRTGNCNWTAWQQTACTGPLIPQKKSHVLLYTGTMNPVKGVLPNPGDDERLRENAGKSTFIGGSLRRREQGWGTFWTFFLVTTEETSRNYLYLT